MENTPTQDPRSKQKLVLLGTLAVVLVTVTAIVIGVYLLLVREIQ